MTPQPSWEALVPRLEADLREREPHEIGSRDDDAWEAAGQLLRARARILLYTHSGLRREDAEDIVQNVLVKLQSPMTMRRLRAAGSAEGYIVVMLRNAATDLMRRRQRDQAMLGSLIDELLGEPAAEPSQVLEIEQASDLAKALASIDEGERNLLKMRFWRNMSIAEIAADVGISYSATAVRLFRILRRLRELMTGAM